MIGFCLVAAGLPVAGPVAAAERIAGPVDHVRDGDTIVVQGVPVRFNGVDAAEGGTRRGEAARAWMVDAVRGRDVSCELNGERSHDRWIGICFIEVDGEWTDLGGLVIAAGLALDCPRYSGGRYAALETARARLVQSRASYCYPR
jgi:endonuclease YncB( thermonuclease family)